MDILDKYLKELDKSDADHANQFEIEGKLQSIRDEIEKSGDNERAAKAQLEMETFSFTKRVENFDLIFSYRFAGAGKNDKGEEIPYKWPDSSFYKDEDYNYISKRFNETKNDYAKLEYGFLLLLGENSKYKRDEIALEVIKSQIRLIEKYIDIIKSDISDSKHYGLYLLNLFEQSFILSYKRSKNNESIKEILDIIKDLIFNTVINWNPKNKLSRFVTDLSDLIINFNKEFSIHDLTKIADKIWEVSHEMQSTYREGSNEAAFIGLEFSKRINYLGKYNWYEFIANNYEMLAEAAKNKNDNILYSHFVENALRIYKIMKNEKKIRELHKIFVQAKSQGGYTSFKTSIPAEIIKESNERVDKFTNENDESVIIYTLATTPMLTSINVLEEETRKSYQKSPLSAMLSKSVVDKMGNTVAEYKYNNKDELFHFNLLNIYGFNFQFISDEICHLFLESIRKKKLTYEGVIEYIISSWVGKDFEKYYNGKLKIINISQSLKKSLQDIFDELNELLSKNNYETDFVSSIDSLTIKFEYIFRFLCENLGIPTYYNQSEGIKHEKSLNSLLEDPDLNDKFKTAGLNDDLFLFKYIFSEKAGWNLRNSVAHGLMDFDEYNYNIAIILVVLILKISTYNFKKTQNNNDSN